MIPSRPSNSTLRRALVAGGILLATAACFVLIKAGLAFAPPFLFAALRLLLAGLALGLLLPLLGQPLLPSRGDWPWLGLLALVSSTFAYGAMFASPARAGAGLAVVLGNVQPLILTGLAIYFLKERLTLTKGLSLGLGLLGIFLMAWPALTSPGGLGISGTGLALASSLGFAIGSLVIRHLEPPHLLTLTAWQLLLGSLPLFAGWLLWEKGAEVRLNLEFIGLVLLLALVGTAFVTAGWYWLLQGSELGRLSQVFFLVPVLGLGLAALFYGERVTWVQGLGLLFIVGGLAVQTLEARPTALVRVNLGSKKEG